jgi:NitT/TauT family transport system substrate-binding protein
MNKALPLLLAVLLCLPLQAARAGTPLRFGVLPVLDTLPLRVAVEEGYFAEQGLDVELVSFNSALERDVALQAGHLDGYFGDLIAAVLLLQNGVDMPVVLTSYRTTPGQRMFGVVTSPKLAGASLADLKARKVGYSKATIMDFLLDKIMEKHGLDQGHFEKVEVKKVPIRMQMLAQGQLDCAILPEALLSLAELQGGSVAATAEDLDLPLTILALDRRFSTPGSGVNARFNTAYAKAVAAIGADPERWRGLMVRTCRVPGPLAGSFPVYQFPAPALPSPAEVGAVTAWMDGAGMLKTPMAYEDAVSPVAP